MKIRSQIMYGAIILMCSFSCASTTMINSTTPGAEVYIGGKYKGTTPYVHRDYLPTGFSRKVEIKKDGYKTTEGKIRKLGRVNAMALYGTVCLGVPVLWVGGYKRFYEFDLIPEGGGEPLKADYLKFGKSFTTSNRALPVYVGSKDGLHFIYAAGYMHALNNDLSLNSSVGVGKKNTGIPIDGYIIGDKKRVVEFFPDDNSIRILTISADGKAAEFEIEKVRYISDICSEDYCYGYKRSLATNNFISYSENSIALYDSHLAKLDSYNSEKKILESYLLSDDHILSLEYQNNRLFLGMRKNGEEQYLELELDESVESRFFRLNINEEFDKCYVSFMTGGIQNKDVFKPSGVNVLTYDLSAFKLLDEKKVALTESARGGRSNYLVNKGVVSDKENVFVHLQEEWVTVTTSSSGSSSASYTTAGLVIINTEDESASQQRISKYVASSVHQDKLSYQVQLKNGRLHYVFNTTVGGKPILNQVVLDDKLEKISWDLHNTYKDEGTIFHGLKSYEMEDGRRFFFHQYKTKLGAAISEF